MRLRLMLAATLVVVVGLPGIGHAARGSTAGPPGDYTAIRGLSTPRYQIKRTTHRIPMRDGVRLYAEVVRPTAPGRWGTILELSPYHGTNADRSGTRILPEPKDDEGNPIGLAGYFAPRGYAVVFVDLRGTGRSEGCLDHMGRKDQKDAYDVVEWAARQSWSNRRVGMTGHSYVGSTPQMAAAQNPPHLVTIVPSAGLAAMYHHEFQYGVPYNLQWVGPLAAYEELAVTRYLDDSAGQNLTFAGCGMTQSAGVTGEAYASGAEVAWHKERDFRKGATASRIPMFVIHGVNDNAARIAALDWFNARRRTGDKAWIGPWAHDPGGNRDDQWTKALHAWFDKHLLRRRVGTGPPVEIFVDDSDRVFTARTWPPPPSRTLVLGALSGDVLGVDNEEESRVSYIADAQGGTTGEFSTGHVAFDTEPFRVETLVVGVPSLRLSVAVGGSRIHIVATLYDVDEDGDPTRMAQATFAVQPELRNGIDKPKPVVPGEVMTMNLTGFAQAYVVPAGHRLRLIVASSHPDKVPTFAEGAAVDVIIGGKRGTRLTLPVIERPVLYRAPF